MASYLRPHPPFDAPQYYFDLYKDRKLEPPAAGDWESAGLLESQGRVFDSKCGPSDPELIRQAQTGYYACITHLDHQIGRLIQALVEYGLYDDTLIFFTSDHGEQLCDHHFFRKSLPYEGSSRIPLILSGGCRLLPGIRPGSTCHSLAELRDIMPTLLDFAGVPVPEEVDGKSLLPLTAHPGDSVRSYLHGEHEYGTLSSQWIVTPTDKFIWFTETGREQYFRLCPDRRELHDEIGVPEYRERIGFLRRLLIKELQDRPEGFTDGVSLIPGRPYRPFLESSHSIRPME